MYFVTANWRFRRGELDLVFLDGDELVVVEVKTRLQGPCAEKYLFDTITRAKKKTLRRLAQICRSKLQGKGSRLGLRIDVVGVIVSSDDFSLLYIEHLRGVL